MKRYILAAMLVAAPALADTPVKPGRIFPLAVTGSLTLTTGGTAQNAEAAQSSNDPISCLIKNPLSSTDQGIATAERVYVNAQGTAAAAAGGSSVSLEAGDWMITGPQTGAVSWIAATTGHKIQGWCWQ